MSETGRVDVAGIADLLGVGLGVGRELARTRGFPAQREGGGWEPDEVRAWVARYADPALARRVPPVMQPEADEAAAYLGAGPVDGGPDHGMMLTWRTGLGLVHLMYPATWVDAPAHVQPTALLEELPADTYLVCVVFPDFGFSGPALECALYETGRSVPARWEDLRRLLGQRAPWWPLALRDPRLITDWRPGDETRTVMVPTFPDTTAWLRAAALEPGPTVVRTTLSWLARVVHHHAYTGMDTETQLFGECADYTHIAPAARPLIPPDPEDSDEPGESERRAAWLEILARDDELAATCVAAARIKDGGSDLPYPRSHRISPTAGQVSAQWAKRLVPAPRTAGHIDLTGTVSSRSPVLAYMHDDSTGIPVVKKRIPGDNDITYLTGTPHRLTTTSPLAELILENPDQIWVRTTDGGIYPAPVSNYAGNSYGYTGSGPATLAHLVNRLLGDITAPATNDIAHPPPGLATLFRQSHPNNTTFTREQLIHARDNGTNT